MIGQPAVHNCRAGAQCIPIGSLPQGVVPLSC
jgi:hypothetical protein